MMNFDEWCYESRIDEQWHALRDEYGDAVPLFSVFKQYRYEEYVEEYKRNLTLDTQ